MSEPGLYEQFPLALIGNLVAQGGCACPIGSIQFSWEKENRINAATVASGWGWPQKRLS